ncbi:MAG: recombinase family protein, partial [Dysosmobacter sp.]|nr:recombinase family protein [Dysosmobacter sp.]
MDIHSIRQALRTKSVYDIPLRVTFYARVSSESDEQLNSLGNQVSYYEEFIRKNSAWEYVPGYVDEGLSAATTKKREDFHRMVEDGKAGLFDLIITKEITRFARNTLDSILYTRELLSAGVGVFFQNDNINTFDEDSELRLTIMSGIAQDELRKLSSRVKFGHAQAIKKNVVLGNSRIFGYVKDGGRLVIDEDEAPMVRELFELYATGDYSMKQIETLFWEKGYHNHNGKKIAHTTMSGMISNPKYKGYYVGNKVKVIDLFTKKQKFLPPEEWVMFKDETGEIVPAIVSEELWDKANVVLKKRSEDVKGRQGICNHANLLTGKLYCIHCGAAYYRRESVDRQGNKNSKWVCSGKIKNGADSCPSFAVYEEELKPLLFEVFRETEEDAQALVEEYIEMYKSLGDGEDTAKQIDGLRQQIQLAQKKKSKLLGYNAAGQLSDRDFLSMNKDCDREISEAERQIYDLEQQQMSRE